MTVATPWCSTSRAEPARIGDFVSVSGVAQSGGLFVSQCERDECSVARRGCWSSVCDSTTEDSWNEMEKVLSRDEGMKGVGRRCQGAGIPTLTALVNRRAVPDPHGSRRCRCVAPADAGLVS